MKRGTWIYGINSVRAAVRRQPDRVLEVRVANAARNSRIQTLMNEAGTAGIACKEVDLSLVKRTVGDVAHQNVIALFRAPDYLSEQDLPALCAADDAVFLIFDRIHDPRNFGACLRTAEACGVTGVVIPAAYSVELTPVVIKTASGAAGLVPVVKVPNLARAIAMMREAGVWVTAAVAEATKSYTEIDYKCSVAFVLGAEGRGLRRLTAESCDHLVSIPMLGEIESLNVSTAAAVLLYEMLRQRARSS